MLVLKNGVEVSVHANAIGKHILLVVEEGIGAEVLSIIDALVDGRNTPGNGGVCRAAHRTLRSLRQGVAEGEAFNFLGLFWFGGSRLQVVLLS